MGNRDYYQGNPRVAHNGTVIMQEKNIWRLEAEACSLDARSKELRRRMLEVMYIAGKGHLPSAFSLTEIARVLYDDVLRYDPAEPHWPDRDRCIMSKGHASLLLYVILQEKGFFPMEELHSFQQFHSRLGGQVSHRLRGVDYSTGSLGHGLSAGVGMALSARLQKRSTQVYVLHGDGELGEGAPWEAMLSAAKHSLGNLHLVVDRNWMQGGSATEDALPLESLADKLSAFGFLVHECNGHDIQALRTLFLGSSQSGKPNVYICHTVKGKGVPLIENNHAWHSRNGLSSQVYGQILQELENYP